MEENSINLGEMFKALRKRWQLIVAITLVITLLASVMSFFLTKPKYETSIKLFVGKEQTTGEGYDNSEILMYQKLLKTYSEVIKTKDLVKTAVKAASMDLNPKDVLSNLTVVPMSDTQILEIKYESNSPEEAMKVINGIKKEFIRISVDIVPNGNIQVLEEATFPENPVSPNKKMNIVIGFLLGAMIGVGSCFLLEFLDNTYKSIDKLEKDFKIPVIGVIPKMNNED
ncbi:Wzz/FepE/Etk N-terminal domain-containing protein [Clostridium sp.]|uniref:YveK family protein n=1 Tax=Clostridium sp. TaxID=1506 RepID=UPI0032180178